MKNIISVILLCAMFCFLSSCEKMGPVSSEEEVAISGMSLFLPCNADTVVTVTMIMDAQWELFNNNEWVAITPMEGEAGEVELKMRILEPNTDIRERYSYFDVRVNEELKRYSLFQRGVNGVELVDTQYIMPEFAGGSVRVEVLANAELDVKSGASWAVVDRVLYNQDSTLLADSVSYSALKKAYIDLTLAENPSGDQRTADIVVSCGGSEQSISILQFAELTDDVDWSKKFYRKALAMKFTGQSCPNCPRMSDAFHNAQSERSDRLEVMGIHSYQFVDQLYYDNCGLFVDLYGVSGWPHGIFNSIARIGAFNLSVMQTMTVSLIDEMLKTPARTAISMNSSYVDGVLTLDGFIAAAEAGSYKVHIHAMENGIRGNQSGSPEGSDYIHDNVLMKSVTYELGDVLSGLGAGDVVPFSIEKELPESIFVNADNAYILIYVTYDTESTPAGSVAYAEYADFGMAVDNVVTLPMNGQATFKYE